MKKENKKLTSRQDFLSVWVSKGAEFTGIKVKEVKVTGFCFANLLSKKGDNYGSVDILRLIYAPESNFFEVMYPDGYVAPRVLGYKKKDMCSDYFKRCVQYPLTHYNTG